LQLRGRGADPRHPDRDGHVPIAPRSAYPETRARGASRREQRLMALSFEPDPCAKCEELLQPYLDRDLSDAEYIEAEKHLDGCSYCRKRYKFEVELRRFVRKAVVEEMPPDLKQKLAALRTPLL